MLAGVNKLRLSFPFTFDPQRLDVIGNLQFIQVQDPSVPKFGVQVIDAYSSE